MSQISPRLIQAVIFDFDGVLLESAEIKTRAFAMLFASICPERVPEIVAYHEANMGYSRYVKFRHIFERILGQPLSLEAEQVLGKRFSAIVIDELLKAPLVPGAKGFVETACAAKRYALFVASGTPEDELHTVAKAKGLWSNIVEWHGAPKTKPAIIRDVLARYHLAKDQVVFVGDAISDQRAAEETGLTFIGRVVTEEHQLSACRYRIRDLSELHPVLQALESVPNNGGSE